MQFINFILQYILDISIENIYTYVTEGGK